MVKKDIKTTIIPRKDTYQNWTAITAGVLALGEFGLDITNNVLKCGDGVSKWIDLPELNKTELSDLGITATSAEINKLDGLTATTAELNYVDGVTSNIQTQLNNKAGKSVATSTANGLMSSTDKSKLDGIEANANNYTHPTYTSKASGLYKVTVDGTGHVSAATAVSKADITALGIPAQDTTYSTATSTTAGLVVAGTYAASASHMFGANANTYAIGVSSNGVMYGRDTTYSAATTAAAGLMSAADKKKLDGIADGANKYVLPTATSTVFGGVKIGFSTSGKNYAVQLSDGKMYVNVPWTDNNTTYTTFVGAVSGSGNTGLVPAPLSNQGGYFLKGNGEWEALSSSDVTGALGYTPVSSTEGITGLSVSGKVITYTKGDGTTGTITTQDTTYSAVTSTANGLMTSTDKSKLDGIASGANKYTLPVTGASILGGVMVPGIGSTAGYTQVLADLDGRLYYKDTNTTYTAVTTSKNGLMTSTDKSKLDGIAANANNYSHPTYTSKASGLYKVTVDGTGHVSAATAVSKADITALGIPAQDTTYSAVSSTANGLMTSTDYVKLAGIANNANNYSHPAGSAASKSSGLYKFSTDSTSHIKAVTAVSKADITALGIPAQDTTYSTATSTTAGLVKVGYTTSGKNYAVQLSDGKMYVNVPWTDSNTTYTTFVGAVSGSGNTGLVPAPQSDQGGYFLKGNGGWEALTKADVTGALGYTPPTTNTTYSTATSTTAGLVKIGYTTSGKNYAVQLSDGKMYVNVPWTDSNTTYSAVTTAANGLMTSTDKSKLDGIAANANNYSHPTYTSKASGLYKVTVDGTGHVSAATAVSKADITALGIPGSDTNTHYTTKMYATSSTGTTGASTTNGNTYLRLFDDSTARSSIKIVGEGATSVCSLNDGTIKISSTDTNTTYSAATTTANGLMTSTDKSKLNGIASGATKVTTDTVSGWGYTKNTGTVTGVKVGSTSYSPSSGVVSLPAYPTVPTSLKNPNAVTIKAGSDTVASYDGSAAKTFTIAACTTAGAFTISDGTTTKVVQLAGKFTDNNTTYSAGTGISLSGTTFSNSGVRSVSTGGNNGTITVNTGGTSAEVAVKGLGSAAYTSSSNYATAGHTHNYLEKTTYEKSAELACGSNGLVCLGKFGAYDTNITIELNCTTSTTYHATIVIHSQNVVANGTGGTVGCYVYDDADNRITPLLSVFRPYGSASRQIEVYANLPGWSKNLVHVQGVALSDGGMTDVLTSVSSIPTSISGKQKVTPVNVLTTNFASISHTHSAATTSATGFMSASDKAKLDGIATGANKYSHPAGSAASKSTGLYKFSTDSTSHIKAVTAVSKADITALGIPAQDTTYSAVSSTANGLMTSTDFSKLAGIASGANKYTHPTYTSKSSGLYKVTVDGTGHVSAATAVSKADITGLGIPAQDTTYTTFVGAVNGSGSIGLVPSPKSDEGGYFLKGNGGWAALTKADVTGALGYTPPTTNTTYSTATSTTAGLVKVGYTTSGKNYAVQLSDGKMYVNVPWTDNNTTYSTATSTTAGLVKIGYTTSGKNYAVQLSDGKMYVNVPWTDNNTTYSAATTTANGLMTSTDKSKLNGIASGANNYALPVTGASILGGVMAPAIGSTTGYTRVLADLDGRLYYQDTNTTYSAGTGISLSGTTFSNSGVRSVSTGGNNGTITVNTGGTSAEVAVKGLGSAAYTSSSNYATAGHTHSGYASSSHTHSNYVPNSGAKTISGSTSFTGPVWIGGVTLEAYIQSVASCLIEGTMIAMADGTYKPIEKVQEGDLLKSVDIETGEETTSVCLGMRIGDYKDYYYCLMFDDGSKVKTNWTHDIYNATKGTWTNTDRELELDDEVIKEDGSRIKFAGKIDAVGIPGGKKCYFYDLISSNNCYYADGILFSHTPTKQYTWVTNNSQKAPSELVDLVSSYKNETHRETDLIQNDEYVRKYMKLFHSMTQKENKLKELKNKLSNTDYIVMKLSEGIEATSEMNETVKSRKEWRKIHNECELELDNIYKEANSLKVQYSSIGEDVLLPFMQLRKKFFIESCKQGNEHLEEFKEYYKNNKNNEE